MICACIDVGSNTTRVLVAEADRGRLTELLQHRAFTRLGRAVTAAGAIPRAKIEEVAAVVAQQRALAEQLGARALRAVATAAIRGAANRDEVVAAVRERGGIELAVLDGEEEARLAFLGATRTLGRPLDGRIAVVDVGGGSTEVAVGTLADGVRWSSSFLIGSGVLAGAPARQVAATHEIEPERVPLLPAGIVILEAAAERLGQPLSIARGGLREGVLLDLAGSHGVHVSGADGGMMGSG